MKYWLNGILALLFCFSASSLSAQPKKTFQDVVFFGDSFTDVGNQGCYTNSDSRYPGQCSVWASEVYRTFMQKELTSSKQGGSDYAVGGQKVGDLMSQVNKYLETHTVNPNTLYIISIGTNDLIAQFSGAWDFLQNKVNQRTPMPQLMNEIFNNLVAAVPVADQISNYMVGKMAEAVDVLTSRGARQILLFNLPDLGPAPISYSHFVSLRAECSRQFQSQPAMCGFISDYIGQMSASTTRVINEALANKFKSHSAVKILDMFYYQQMLLGNYKNFGTPKFTNSTNGCKSTGADCSTYVFWDNLHPTVNAHQVSAEWVKQFILNMPS